MTTTMTHTSSAVARRLLHAIVSRDDLELHELLSDDIWMRAMLVRGTVEAHDAVGAVAMLQSWFGDAVELQTLHASTHSVGGREHLTYRLRLRPGWASDTWHVIEQTGYARIRDGQVRRLDLVCTGFVPEVTGVEAS